MSYNKPFHRNYRPIKEGGNSDYSSWAYIVDHDYSENPEYYTRAFSIIQEDILKLFEYVEPSYTNRNAYSFRIQELLIRICVEVEANFKAILRENTFSPKYKNGKKAGTLRPEKEWKIQDFKVINKTHHLSSYVVDLPFWRGKHRSRQPFEGWQSNNILSWYTAYNAVKHDRSNNFGQASFDNLIEAYTGLFVLLSAQFGTQSFTPGSEPLGVNVDSYYEGEFGLGGFLIVHFPNDWEEEEMYDFDWSVLKNEKDKFQKIDYNNL